MIFQNDDLVSHSIMNPYLLWGVRALIWTNI
jgi:hypothetical protein